MNECSGMYPRVRLDGAGSGVVSQAGGVVLLEAMRTAGLDRSLSSALAPWRKPASVHDPAKVVCDLAVTLVVGGDCLADIAVLRAEPGRYGRVASDPTVSRTIDALAADAPAALAASNTARAQTRTRVWQLAGEQARRMPVPMRPGRWSWTWTPPWSPPTPRNKPRRPRSSGGSGSTRCAVRRC